MLAILPSNIFFALTFLTFSVSASDCLFGTHLHRRQSYGYSGESGPTNWHDLDPANEACGVGNFQSPIVLNGSTPFAIQPPFMTIPQVPSANFTNVGATLQVATNGTTIVDGEEYALRQFHFHTPSEHRINNEFYPLEMQMVHESVNGSIEVITFLFELSERGETTELLTSVIQNIDKVEHYGNSSVTGPLNFTVLIDAVQTQPLYTYNGSLTTPPCTEGITFFIVSNPLPIDVATFNALKHVMKFNARYAQNYLGGSNLLEVVSQLGDQGIHISFSRLCCKCAEGFGVDFVEAGYPGGNSTDVVLSPNTSDSGVRKRLPSVKFRV
ncbi:hypothetical protein VKT23_008373 [Stygiomarasmius scandens]|uniref:carbonic anhydrase n=1 Tax=Marasmiellus scandens TaxID=2682957 RepID=A0ABR1JI17_9AGAR